MIAALRLEPDEEGKEEQPENERMTSSRSEKNVRKLGVGGVLRTGNSEGVKLRA